MDIPSDPESEGIATTEPDMQEQEQTDSDVLPFIVETNAQAIALRWMTQSVDAFKRCENCALFTPNVNDPQIGQCPLFPGLTTRAGAVCSAFVPRN